MLLTITTTHQPATDIGYLLHKNPAKVQTFSFTAGKAHVFYPEASEVKTTAALLLEIDPVGLVRGKKDGGGENFSLKNYVNDRPYVASSFMSVAIAQVFSSALGGRCKDRPELVDVKLPLEAKISVLPSRGGKKLLERLFSPLGYTLSIEEYFLDEQFPEWGLSPYYIVTFNHTITLKELLLHLYVLIPVLDNDKHYFIGTHEMEKLLEKGAGWLNEHPEKEFITRRYLKNIGSLSKQALLRMMAEDVAEEEVFPELNEEKEVREEKEKRLHDLRLQMVFEKLKENDAKRVIDMGCGEGKLMQLLLKDKSFTEILGMDVSYRSLEIAKERLHFDELPAKQKDRLKFIHGSLTYRDKRLSGYDGAAIVEVIEHLDVPRLSSFERVVFEFATPGTVVITTPNAEYNVKFEKLSAGTFRHSDHRFEWTREEFESWSANIAGKYGYEVSFFPIGTVDDEVGSPSQMAVFKLV